MHNLLFNDSLIMIYFIWESLFTSLVFENLALHVGWFIALNILNCTRHCFSEFKNHSYVCSRIFILIAYSSYTYAYLLPNTSLLEASRCKLVFSYCAVNSSNACNMNADLIFVSFIVLIVFSLRVQALLFAMYHGSCILLLRFKYYPE